MTSVGAMMVATMSAHTPALDVHTAREVDGARAGIQAHEAQERVVELKARVAAELELRDRAVRHAVGLGVKIPALARAVGISNSRVYDILGTAA